MRREIILTENAPAPIGPYSQAVLIGNTLYVSGQIALEPISNRLLVGDIRDETLQVLKNIEAVLKAAGLNFEHVVKASVFMKDLERFKEMNEVYNEIFEKIKPARETVQVSRLPKDVNIEISVIAVG